MNKQLIVMLCAIPLMNYAADDAKASESAQVEQKKEAAQDAELEQLKEDFKKQCTLARMNLRLAKESYSEVTSSHTGVVLSSFEQLHVKKLAEHLDKGWDILDKLKLTLGIEGAQAFSDEYSELNDHEDTKKFFKMLDARNGRFPAAKLVQYY